MTHPTLEQQLTELNQLIAGLQKQLSGPALEAALQPLLEKQATLQAQLAGDQSVVGSSAGRDIISGDRNITVYAEQGARVVIGEEAVAMAAVEAETQLGRYLQHLIGHNRYLRLQGIRSGGRLVHIELDQIYVTLRATRRRRAEVDKAWLQAEAGLAPGERRRLNQPVTETVTVSVNEALADSRRLVVLGDPGSGKTTLLRYLTLLYARDVADRSDRVQRSLALDESGCLPILLELRRIGAFLKTHHAAEDGTDGHALLLDYLRRALRNERLDLPADFFDEWLQSGRAVILLDGLDEVADPDRRRRVARLVEAFCRAYPDCRYVVTSRIVGYSGPARLGEDFNPTTVQDFTLADVERFLSNWHRLLAAGQMGPGPAAEAHAAQQTRHLRQAIEGNERIRELAINPLMLTVIAMIHRDRVKLPDRRAELYAEAVDVLLGKWDEARGVTEAVILEGQPFDTGDKRLMLQNLALHLQAQELKEIDAAELRQWLGRRFYDFVGNWRQVGRTVDRFLQVIAERSGLLTARGEGIYAFSHLTFQEYLAALAIAGRDDYIAYTLDKTPSPWWREVILLAAGHLSSQSRQKTTRLIQAIADLEPEPEPYHNLVLAAECVRDVGDKRVTGGLAPIIQQRLRAELETPPPSGGWFGSVQVLLSQRLSTQEVTRRRIAAAEALAKIGGQSYWTLPHGEPEWVEIPSGEFWLGSEQGSDNEKPLHKLYLDTFLMARTPVTNAQYRLFVRATKHRVPDHWQDNRPPKGLESHPVVNVTWHEALAYCRWLSEMTGKTITLPSEAEWEKAARGSQDKRAYPWGDTFEATRCNCGELGLRHTTPVGIFPNGASPSGCLDMSGNVWEWTRSLWGEEWDKPTFKYPYEPTDGREDLEASDDVRRVVRGGAFNNGDRSVRCAFRNDLPYYRYEARGFRVSVVVSPLTSES